MRLASDKAFIVGVAVICTDFIDLVTDNYF